jgi:hypothetical protein
VISSPRRFATYGLLAASEETVESDARGCQGTSLSKTSLKASVELGCV